jgi:hypothetical protein
MAKKATTAAAGGGFSGLSWRNTAYGLVVVLGGWKLVELLPQIRDVLFHSVGGGK